MWKTLMIVLVLVSLAVGLSCFEQDPETELINMQNAPDEVNVIIDILDNQSQIDILEMGQDAMVEILENGSVYQSFFYSQRRSVRLAKRVYRIIVRSQNFLNHDRMLDLSGYDGLEGNLTIPLDLAPRHGVNFEIVDGRGNAVDGATITFNGSVLSGLRVDDLPVGTYSYRVEKRNYRTVQDSVYISGPMNIRVELELITYRVTFSVKNSYNEDVTGVSITAGGVRFSGLQGWLPAGSYNYTISKQRHPNKTGSFRVSGTTSVPVTGYDPANHYLPSSNHTFRCSRSQRKQLNVSFVTRGGATINARPIPMGTAQPGVRELLEISVSGIIRERQQSASNLKWVIVTEQ